VRSLHLLGLRGDRASHAADGVDVLRRLPVPREAACVGHVGLQLARASMDCCLAGLRPGLHRVGRLTGRLHLLPHLLPRLLPHLPHLLLLLIRLRGLGIRLRGLGARSRPPLQHVSAARRGGDQHVRSLRLLGLRRA